jgi:hypothetical protein
MSSFNKEEKKQVNNPIKEKPSYTTEKPMKNPKGGNCPPGSCGHNK